MDSGFEFGGGAMHAATHLALGEQAEEALNLIDPGSRGGGEVDVPAGAFGEPVANALGLVRAGIVDDEMDIEIVRDLGLHRVEELAELLRTMPPEATADHLPDLDVQSGEQRERAMPLV